MIAIWPKALNKTPNNKRFTLTVNVKRFWTGK